MRPGSDRRNFPSFAPRDLGCWALAAKKEDRLFLSSFCDADWQRKAPPRCRYEQNPTDFALPFPIMFLSGVVHQKHLSWCGCWRPSPELLLHQKLWGGTPDSDLRQVIIRSIRRLRVNLQRLLLPQNTVSRALLSGCICGHRTFSKGWESQCRKV